MKRLTPIPAGWLLPALILAAACTAAQTPAPAAPATVPSASNSTAAPPPSKPVADLVADLGNADFQKRQAAEQALVEIGPPAAPLLQTATKDENPERAIRAKSALKRILEQWWGKPVEGIQIQLRTDRRPWKADEVPLLSGSVRNSGKEKWWIPKVLPLLFLTVDGRSYYLPENSERLVNDFIDPGQTKPLPDITLSDWLTKDGQHEPLRLGAGKHTVTIHFKPEQLLATEDGDISVRQAEEAVSNPVEIEILPAATKPDATSSAGS